jgi:hypothetical protein
VEPYSTDEVSKLPPNSGVAVRTRLINPAARQRSVRTESSGATCPSSSRLANR